MDRKKHFEILFLSKGYDIKKVASMMGIKPDSLYRKLKGINGFNEEDIKIILKILDNMKFEEVFI